MNIYLKVWKWLVNLVDLSTEIKQSNTNKPELKQLFWQFT